MHILIVDDEMQSRLLIRKLILRLAEHARIAEAASLAEAIKEISAAKPDLIFLDVQLKGETGFDLLDRIAESELPVIFITAHSDYAVRAFRYHALDYLLKPVDPIEFEQAFNRVRANKNSVSSGERYQRFSQHLASTGDIPDKVAIPTAEGYVFVEVSQILYCKAAGNYTELFLSGKRKILSSYTLGYYEELLLHHRFFRVHRSFLINLKHIKMYRRGDGGTVVMDDDMEIEVSRTNKDAFLRLFKS